MFHTIEIPTELNFVGDLGNTIRNKMFKYPIDPMSAIKIIHGQIIFFFLDKLKVYNFFQTIFMRNFSVLLQDVKNLFFTMNNFFSKHGVVGDFPALIYVSMSKLNIHTCAYYEDYNSSILRIPS